MASIIREITFDADYFEQFDDLDDGEQNLEEEAVKLLESWDRTELMREISEEREKIKRNSENTSIVYYDGDSKFESLISDMTPLGDGQVYIKVTEPNPSGKLIKGSDTILFDRIGYLEFEAIPFESSILEGKPTKLSLMEGPICAGMLQALINIREGESADILIRSHMAYGELGCPPIIPEDASLLYHVKIYKIWDESLLSTLMNVDQSLVYDIPVKEKIALVEEHKEVANQYLKNGVPRDAIIRYKAAIKCLDELPPYYLEGCERVSKLMITLLQNAAIAFNELGMHKSATKAAKRALFIDHRSIKAYYQLAKARISLNDYSNALKWIEKAIKICPNNPSFDQLKLQLDFQYRNEKKKRDEIMRRMSKACK